MAISESYVRLARGSEAKSGLEIPVNERAIFAYYRAKILLGIATPQDVRAALSLEVPQNKVELKGSGDVDYSTVEGPNVSGLIAGLKLKLQDINLPFEDQLQMVSALDTLDENSTKPDTNFTFWNLGDRATVTGYRVQRTINEIRKIARVQYNNVSSVLTVKDAEEALSGKRELILSNDPLFYKVHEIPNKKTTQKASSEVELYRGLLSGVVNLHANGDEEQAKAKNEKKESDRGKEPPLLIPTEIKDGKKRQRRPHARRKLTLTKNGLLAVGTSVATLAGVGLEASGTTSALDVFRNRPTAVTRTFDTHSQNDLAADVASLLPNPGPATLTTVAKAEPTITTTTVLSIPEVTKPVDPIGVAWLSDTMNPWKEQIATESAKYGIDAALPAILMQVKTAGDYTIHTADLTGLFLLSNDVIKDGMSVKDLGIPSGDPVVVGLDARNNIKIGVWYIAKKYKELGNSINKTALELLGKDVEMAGMVEGMWNERKQMESPAFNKWKEKYGNRLIRNANEKLSSQHML